MARIALIGVGRHAHAILGMMEQGAAYTVDPFAPPAPGSTKRQMDMIPEADRVHLGCGVARDMDLSPRIDAARLFPEGRWANVLSRRTTWDANYRVGVGITAFPGVYVGAAARLGNHVLLNYGAQIGHDCMVEDHCVIGPGAILCGAVHLGPRCRIGAGAIILQGVKLDEDVAVPAGSLVVEPDDFRKPVPMVRGN